MTTKYLIFAAALAVVGLIGWLLALQARETVEELETKLKEAEERRTKTRDNANECLDNVNKCLANAESDNEILRKELKEAKRQTGIWRGATTAVTRMALKEITADKTARPTPAERRPAAVPALDPGRVVIIRGAVPLRRATEERR